MQPIWFSRLRLCRFAHVPVCTQRDLEMFRLVTTVRRGSASNYPAAWARYDTLEAARAAAAVLLREERVTAVMIVENGLERTFVEWCTR